MSLGPVGSASSLVSLLKAELAVDSRRRTAGKEDVTAAPRTGSTATRPALRPQLVDAVKHVDCADPDAVKSARRRIIRSVLVWQFGAELREHSQWEAMLDSIDATLEQDAQHLSQFQSLIAELQQAG